MKEAGIRGEIIPWRDVLHDGPVPAGLSLEDLSRVRIAYLASLDDAETHVRDFTGRDAFLQRFTEFDQVVLWFEWDLYDQLQLIQILDYLAGRLCDSGLTPPPLQIVSLAGYLGTLAPDRFPPLYEGRRPISRAMLSLGQAAWTAFTSSDPRDVSALASGDTSSLPFLDGALWRLLEELPSRADGLSRAERQLLEGLAAGASNFSELFQRASAREERLYCGDASAALYLERLSGGPEPLVLLSSGDRVRSPRAAESSAFRRAELKLTATGKAVLAGERDWIAIGGSDRWLGGVHLEGANARWRWDRETRTVIDVTAA